MFQKGMRLPPCRSQLKRWQLRAAAVPSGHALNSGAYTVDALASIRAAQREALRARSMFVAPPHLLLGVIIANPNCAGARLLASSGMGDQTTARRMLGLTPDQVEEQMSSAASPGDLHFAPDARRALSIAATTAVEEGAAAAGTAHLVLGLLCCDCGAINGALDGLGVPRGQLAEQAREEGARSDEQLPVAAPANAQQQAAELVQRYRQYVDTHGSAAPPPEAAQSALRGSKSAGTGEPRPGADTGERVVQILMTPEDDDIYN